MKVYNSNYKASYVPWSVSYFASKYVVQLKLCRVVFVGLVLQPLLLIRMINKWLYVRACVYANAHFLLIYEHQMAMQW